ncbi:MAG: hypothetical protein ACYDBP_04455 [Leptospirales bacterium]
MSKNEQFDWENEPSVVVRHYGSIAVYKNDFSDMVLRQEKQDEFQEEDSIIVIRAVDLPLLIKALQKETKSENDPEPEGEVP